MKEDTLLLVHSLDSYFARYIKNHGYKIDQVFRNQNIFFRAIRKFEVRYFSKIQEKWLERWKEHVSEYKTIILFANPMYSKVLAWIRSYNPSARIVVWYMDPYITGHMDIGKNLHVEQWSFDKEDCKKYGFTFCNTFYCTDEQRLNKAEEHTDVFFVGLDKGRYDYIMKIKQVLQNKGLNCDIRIIRDKNYYKNIIHNMKKHYCKPIRYNEVLNAIQSTKCLLDINQNGQSGLSQRPFEALFYEKKLITNNPQIYSYDFYNKNNIYVIENEDLKGIDKFLRSPYQKVSSKLKETYTFEKWLSTIMGN